MYGIRRIMLLLVVFILGGLFSRLNFEWFIIITIPLIIAGIIEYEETSYKRKNA